MIKATASSLEMDRIDLILPVPLHRAKQRQRKFNQAKLLAEHIALAFCKRLEHNALVKTRFAAPQAGLSRTERLKNIKDSFEVKKPKLVKDKNILLVDDVFTTGATVNECAKVLKEAGADNINVLSLART